LLNLLIKIQKEEDINSIGLKAMPMIGYLTSIFYSYLIV